MPQPLPATVPNSEPQMIKKNYNEVATSELQSLSLFFVLITEEGSNHYAIIGSSYCPCKMLKTFFTDYIRLGLSVQCLSSAILQQWTIGRQSQAMACL